MRVGEIERRESALGSAINTKATLGIILAGIYLTVFTTIVWFLALPISILIGGLEEASDFTGEFKEAVVEFWTDVLG